MITVVTALQYSPAVLARRHSPPKARPYAEYRECLRLEFKFSCVYCLTTEREAGLDEYSGFEIEHFQPKGRFKRLRNYYPNLYWACGACNRAKGDSWPTPSELAQGYRFVDPGNDALASHLELKGRKIVALTTPGEFTVTEIRLDSPLHETRRQLRIERLKKFEVIDSALQALRVQVAQLSDPAPLASQLSALEQSLASVRADFEPSGSPWDAPGSCRCNAPPKTLRKLTRRQRRAARLKHKPGKAT